MITFDCLRGCFRDRRRIRTPRLAYPDTRDHFEIPTMNGAVFGSASVCTDKYV
jgi:hypothetical protein